MMQKQMQEPDHIRKLVSDLFPELSGGELLLAEAHVLDIIEGKDVGRFRGEISVFKQQAIDTASKLPKPVVGRRAMEKQAGKQLEKVVSRVVKEMESLVSRFRSESPSRKLSKTKFKEKMKASLRAAYRDAYELGTVASGLGRARAGLVTHTGVDEKRWIDNIFSQEQKHFNKFLNDLIKGTSKTKASIRIKNYANAVRSVYEGSRILQIPDDTIIHWVLQSNNPCSDCRLLHRLSPYTPETLPTTPKGGSTRCLSYCYCKLRTVKGTRAEIERIKRKNRSAQYLLKKLKQNRKQRG